MLTKTFAVAILLAAVGVAAVPAGAPSQEYEESYTYKGTNKPEHFTKTRTVTKTVTKTVAGKCDPIFTYDPAPGKGRKPVAPGPWTTRPFPTVTDTPGYKPPVPEVTHIISVGKTKNKFEPERVNANVGDWVEWRFYPGNHTVIQSDFESCGPKADGTGFHSGFDFQAVGGLSVYGFRVQVKTSKPIWFHGGEACRKKMVGVINESKGVSPTGQIRSLKAFKEQAPNLLVVLPVGTKGGKIVEV